MQCCIIVRRSMRQSLPRHNNPAPTRRACNTQANWTCSNNAGAGTITTYKRNDVTAHKGLQFQWRKLGEANANTNNHVKTLHHVFPALWLAKAWATKPCATTHCIIPGALPPKSAPFNDAIDAARASITTTLLPQHAAPATPTLNASARKTHDNACSTKLGRAT